MRVRGPWRAWACLALTAARGAQAAYCEPGTRVEALFGIGTSTTEWQYATITHIDLLASPVRVTVHWDSGSNLHKHLELFDTQQLRALDGSVCELVVDLGQSFNATTGIETTLVLTGPTLTDAARLLLTYQQAACGHTAAVMHPDVQVPPRKPIGSVSMFYTDVVISAAGTYRVCFYSGTNATGLGADDIGAYATALGELFVMDAPTTTTTTTSTATVYNRRRGTAYNSSTLRVTGSWGTSLTLTANPAAWNVHLPKDRPGTCRTCPRFSESEVDGNIQVFRRTILDGFLRPAPKQNFTVQGETVYIPGELGDGCSASSSPVPIAGGEILFVERGGCTFEAKAAAAAGRGYSALLVADYHQASTLPDMAAVGGRAAELLLTIPAWVAPKEEADALVGLLVGDSGVRVFVEDLQRKLRLSTALSDGHGPRDYKVQ